MRNQIRQQCLSARHRKCSGAAQHHHRREHRPSHRNALDGEPEQQHSAERLGEVAATENLGAIVVIGNLPRGQDQHHERQELG